MPEIRHILYEVSGSTRAEIRDKLSLLPAAGEGFHKTAKCSHESFSPDAPLRMVLVLDGNSNIHLLREKALSVLDGEREHFGDDVFFSSKKKTGKIAFLLPGQGSQYPGMGKDLSRFPAMKRMLSLAEKSFEKEAAPNRKGTSLVQSIYPETGNTRETEETLRSTDLAQCAIGAVSLGMAEILEGSGIRPDALCGHSYGELPALCLANIFSSRDCLSLSVIRGKLMAEDPDNPKDRGGMMAVRAEVERVRQIIDEEKLDLVLANENSPSQCVLSGTFKALDHATGVLKQHKIRGVRLPVSAAFHSPLMEDAVLPFKKALEAISFGKPLIPVMSNAKGDFYPENPEAIRRVLASQLLSPVRFIRNIEGLFDAGARIFIEVGPKNVLTGLAASILDGRPGVHCMAVDASSGKNSGERDLAILFARLVALGHPVSPPVNSGE